MRRWDHQLTHLHIHIDCSINVSLKITKIQSFISFLFFIRFTSNCHCSILFFFSFYWINLNLDRISPLISTITVHDHYMAVETGYWIIQNDIQIIVEYLWKWAVCNRVLIGTQGLVHESEVQCRQPQILFLDWHENAKSPKNCNKMFSCLKSHIDCTSSINTCIIENKTKQNCNDIHFFPRFLWHDRDRATRRRHLVRGWCLGMMSSQAGYLLQPSSHPSSSSSSCWGSTSTRRRPVPPESRRCQSVNHLCPREKL